LVRIAQKVSEREISRRLWGVWKVVAGNENFINQN
jgi:hypothetical protein